MHNAASLAGIGFGNSSCGIAHSCGHALGGVFHFRHGIGVGVMLPYVLEFNKAECEEKYKDILDSLSVSYDDPTVTLVNMLKALMKKIGIATNLKEMIPEDDWKQNFEQLIEFAKTDVVAALNPRFATEDDFRNIFQCAYEGKSVYW
jgi:alcohol dehydrogenase class IV